MLKTFEWLAILAVVVLLLSVVGISYLSSPPSGQPREQQAAAQTEAKQQSEEQHSLRGFVRFMFPDAISIFTFWLTLATIGLGIVAVLQIGFLDRSERIAAETAQAAKDSADIANKTLTATQRPWIYPVISVGSNMLINDDGATITFGYTLKNSGNTPAINVDVYPRFFAFQFGKVTGTPPNFTVEIPQTDVAVDLVKFCNEQTVSSEMKANVSWLSGDPIFPDRELRSAVIVTIPKAEIDAAREQSDYKSFTPVLLFCVTYRSPFDTKSHHTGLAFQLFRSDPASAGGAREFSPDDKLTLLGQLRLIPNPFRGGVAD
jgi:hypothetical protein